MPYSDFLPPSLPMHIFGSTLRLCCTFLSSSFIFNSLYLVQKRDFCSGGADVTGKRNSGLQLALRRLLRVITLTRLLLTRSSSRYWFSPLFTTLRWAITMPITLNKLIWEDYGNISAHHIHKWWDDHGNRELTRKYEIFSILELNSGVWRHSEREILQMF